MDYDYFRLQTLLKQYDWYIKIPFENTVTITHKNNKELPFSKNIFGTNNDLYVYTDINYLNLITYLLIHK